MEDDLAEVFLAEAAFLSDEELCRPISSLTMALLIRDLTTVRLIKVVRVAA